MTTEAAAAFYLAEHQLRWSGRPFHIFNPNGASVEALPVIYGFNNGGSYQMLLAQLMAEDGTALGQHCCSNEGYMPSDLGCIEGSRPDRHETFREHYPDGYRMEFIPYKAVPGHAGLMAAIERNNIAFATMEGAQNPSTDGEATKGDSLGATKQ